MPQAAGADYPARRRLEARRAAAGFLSWLGAGVAGCGSDASEPGGAEVLVPFRKVSARSQ